MRCSEHVSYVILCLKSAVPLTALCSSIEIVETCTTSIHHKKKRKPKDCSKNKALQPALWWGIRQKGSGREKLFFSWHISVVTSFKGSDKCLVGQEVYNSFPTRRNQPKAYRVFYIKEMKGMVGFGVAWAAASQFTLSAISNCQRLHCTHILPTRPLTLHPSLLGFVCQILFIIRREDIGIFKKTIEIRICFWFISIVNTCTECWKAIWCCFSNLFHVVYFNLEIKFNLHKAVVKIGVGGFPSRPSDSPRFSPWVETK